MSCMRMDGLADRVAALAWMMTIAVCGLILLAGSACLFGCNLFDSHAKEFDLMRGMAMDATNRLGDGGIAQMQVSGQGLNPGIVVEAAIVYRATARYDGLAGQFGVSAQGKLGPRDNLARAWEVVNDSTRSAQERLAVVRDIIAAIVSPATRPAQ